MHSEPVQVFSVEIACSYNLPSGIIHILKIATSFHEIVKIGIPDNIFLKPGCFDAAEWQVMKKHSIIGEQIMLATELEGADKQQYLFVITMNSLMALVIPINSSGNAHVI